VARLFEFVAVARDKSKDAFLAAYPHAFLLHRKLETPDSGERGFRTATVAPAVNELLRAVTSGEIKVSPDVALYDVYPVLKKPDSPWSGRVSVGRTRTNDIAINESAISKLHAYIQGEPPNVTITDVGSRNGIMINGQKIAANKDAPLKSGDAFALGSVPFVFYDAQAFYAFVKGTILAR
jgi:hypothetical protein